MGATGDGKRETSLWAFLRSFISQWFALMSGGLGVFLTIWACFVGSGLGRLGLGALAVLCFFGASYLVWAEERRKANELSKQLEPAIRLTFFPDATEKITTTEFINQYHHIGEVENTGGADIKECKIQLQVRGENESRVNFDLYPFAPFALARGERKKFDISIVVPKDTNETSFIGHHTEYPRGNWHWSPEPFRLKIDAYRILLVVLSDAAPPVKRPLRLARAGDRWAMRYAAI